MPRNRSSAPYDSREAGFHRAIKTFLTKSQQGRVMGIFRGVSITVTPEMVREALAHLPHAADTPTKRWAWIADFLNTAMQHPTKLCECCGVSLDGVHIPDTDHEKTP